MCHCGNTGWNGHQIRVSTGSELWRREILPLLLPGLKVATFDHESSTLPTSYPGCTHSSDSIVLNAQCGWAEDELTASMREGGLGVSGGCGGSSMATRSYRDAWSETGGIG